MDALSARLMICCNDRHGQCEGRVGEVAVYGEDGLSLELVGDPVDLAWHLDAVSINGRPLQVLRSRRHVGNVHWDEVVAPLDEVAYICQHLFADCHWTRTYANPADVWDEWLTRELANGTAEREGFEPSRPSHGRPTNHDRAGQ